MRHLHDIVVFKHSGREILYKRIAALHIFSDFMCNRQIYRATFRNRKADADDVRLVRVQRRLRLVPPFIIRRSLKVECDNAHALDVLA